jgi:predicted ABC-type ATPase
MVAGPNGSGKSTLIRDFLVVQKLPLGFILNPDTFESDLLKNRFVDLGSWGVKIDDAEFRAFFGNHPLGNRVNLEAVSIDANVLKIQGAFQSGYCIAVFADLLRRKWLEARQSFTFETVMSSRDKLDLMHDATRAGFRTYLYYICTDTPIINEQRVAIRALKGGHDVPRDKIASRYERSLALLPEAISLVDRAFLFDNSEQSHQLVAEFEGAKLIAVAASPPTWFDVLRKR